jgi:hypothetical protein
MKTNIIFLSLAVFVVFDFVSCKTNYYPIRYKYNPTVICDDYNLNEIRQILLSSDDRAIILQNDSILTYWKRYGGLGSATTVKYTIINHELITDSLNLNGYEIPNVTNVHFLYSRDNLINKSINEYYYNQKYIDKIKTR